MLCENPRVDEPYMVCNCRWDNPLGINEYYGGVVTVDFLEAVREYIKRIDALAQEVETEQGAFQNEREVLTAADCIPRGLENDLTGKLIIIKQEVLAPEYRAANHQIKIVTGGFGASPNSRGNAVFCKDLYSGKETRFERYDVAGVIDPGKIPEWAVKKLALMDAIKETGVFEYGGYHFKPYRQFRKGEVKRRLAGDSREWKTDVQYEMRNMHSDRELGLSKHDWKKAEYSHEGFYAASGNSEADIFICVENGKLYVPYGNELYQYSEPPSKTKAADKKPSLLGRLDDAKAEATTYNEGRKDAPKTKKRGEMEVE